MSNYHLVSGLRAIRVTALAAGALACLGVIFVFACELRVTSAARGRVYRDLAAVPVSDVAIVPGAPTVGGHPTAVLIDRLGLSLDLYRAKKVGMIFVSGVDTASDPQVTASVRWLAAHGVPERDIFRDARGTRTRATMQNAAELGVRSGVICTQAPNVARALFLAQQAGVDAVGALSSIRLSTSQVPARVEALKSSLAVMESYLLSGTHSRAPVAQLGAGFRAGS